MTETRSTKTWKDYLLASGLPLEQSVIGVLQRLGIDRPREYRYERTNEHGVLTGFSVDVFASRRYDEQALFLEMLIECKYRHDSARWVFIPDEFAKYTPSFTEVFVIFDRLSKNFVDRDSLDRVKGSYELAYKGVELFESDKNAKSIEQCVHQLRYAVLENAIDDLALQADAEMGVEYAFVQVPIVVTTAQLWRVRPGVTLDVIRDADELGEVADEKDVIILHDPPDKAYQSFAKRRFLERLSDSERAAIEEALQRTGVDVPWDYATDFASMLNSFVARTPSMFVVIRYPRFESAIKNLLGFFANPAIVKPRRPPVANKKSRPQ